MSFDLKNLGGLVESAMEMFGGKENLPANLGDLFTEEFMNKFTNSPSIQAFLSSGSFEAVSLEEISSLSQEALNNYVVKNTQFANWQDMLTSAAKEYAAKKMSGQ